MNITELSVSRLQHAIAIKKQIGKLQKQLEKLLGSAAEADGGAPRRGGMSAAARGRIAAAQRARWAKARKGTSKPKRKVSAAARKRLSLIAKARWAKVRATGRKTL